MDDVDLNGEVFYKPEKRENLSFNGKKE